MSDKGQATVRIKWVRSGIGFDHHQKRIVRSLGLKKLNQEVERPDTPQIRGLVAQVPHLVEIVGAPSIPAWTKVPEYVIYPPAAEPAKPAEPVVEAAATQAENVEAPDVEAVAPTPSPQSELGVESVAGAATAEAKSGIERHAEVLRAAREEGETPPGESAPGSAESAGGSASAPEATPAGGGAEGGAASEEPSPRTDKSQA